MSLIIRVEEDNGPETYVKKSHVEGFGLFSSRAFEPGDVVVDYNLFPSSWYKMKYADLTEEQISRNAYVMLDNEYCLTNDKYSKFSFINHSREPNCDWIVRDRVIVANRHIPEDEELSVDYRMEPRPNRVGYPSWI
jgi:hypothetical protein